MGLLDKINRWRGIYGDSVTASQEFASFPLNFDSFEEFADPFAHSMSLEIFKAKSKEKVIEDGVPYILWGDRPASDEYVYIYRTDVLTDEKLDGFNEGFESFIASLEKDPKIVVITLLCVEESSSAFEKYCSSMPCTDGYDLIELRAGIDFDKHMMHTGIVADCVGEHAGRNIRKEFLRMVRVAENYFKG